MTTISPDPASPEPVTPDGGAAGVAQGGPAGQGRGAAWLWAMVLGLWARPAYRAGALNIFNYGAAQVLRFVSNIALAQLVAPSAFGVLALAATFRQGMEMLSDIGIGPSIIQHKDGERERFVNTAWTMQVLRGGLLFLIALAMTYPLSLVYSNMPSLVWIFPAVAFNLVIAGFNSTAMYTLNRNLRLGRITILNLGNQAITIVVMLALAWWFTHEPRLAGYEPWAMVIGGLVGQVISTIGSWYLDRSVRNRLAWDAEAARSIFHFAKWVFVSTLLTYVVLRLDHFLLGRLLTQSQFGVYSIAQNLATVMPQLVTSVGSAVIFPALARVARERPELIRHKVRQVRMLVIVPAAAASGVLIVLGPMIIALLYRDVYADAGWKLQILAAGSFAMMVATTYGAAMLALGRSEQIVYLLLSMLVFLLVGTLGGYHLAPRLGYEPATGFLVGLVAAEWLNYPFVARRARRQGVYTPEVDAIVLGIALVAIGVAVWMG